VLLGQLAGERGDHDVALGEPAGDLAELALGGAVAVLMAVGLLSGAAAVGGPRVRPRSHDRT
jgi:hypothetical protein